MDDTVGTIQIDAHDPETPSERDELCVAIVETVAAKEGLPPTELEPLYDVVDPEALTDVVRSIAPTGTVELLYRGYRIVVTGDGRIDL